MSHVKQRHMMCVIFHAHWSFFKILEQESKQSDTTLSAQGGRVLSVSVQEASGVQIYYLATLPHEYALAC